MFRNMFGRRRQGSKRDAPNGRGAGHDAEARPAAARADVHDRIGFTLDMATRRGELLQLRWSQVDVDRSLVHFAAATTKTAQGYTLTLTPRRKEILKRRRIGPDG